jgi:hypothetical protein
MLNVVAVAPRTHAAPVDTANLITSATRFGPCSNRENLRTSHAPTTAYNALPAATPNALAASSNSVRGFVGLVRLTTKAAAKMPGQSL